MLVEMDKFLSKMHLGGFAITLGGLPHAFSAFFAYDVETSSLIIASDTSSLHGASFCDGVAISGVIALDTRVVGLIKGIQIWGKIFESDENDRKIYYSKFPYAIPMRPILWRIQINKAKLTDNKIAFGKKLIWEREK